MREGREEGWLDRLLSAFGDAVADMRGQLVDEAWFGRGPVGGGGQAAPAQLRCSDDLMPRRSFEEDWAPRSSDPAHTEPDRGIDL